VHGQLLLLSKCLPWLSGHYFSPGVHAGAHWVHVDSFDGSSMANGNLTIGPPVIKALRKALPHAFLDVHLAVDVSVGGH
jgi:pentose-5-phosphate-3-epimerase